MASMKINPAFLHRRPLCLISNQLLALTCRKKQNKNNFNTFCSSPSTRHPDDVYKIGVLRWPLQTVLSVVKFILTRSLVIGHW